MNPHKPDISRRKLPALDRQVYQRMFRPREPQQEYIEETYDEFSDSYTYEEVVLSDEEFAKRHAAWEKAVAEFDRTFGRVVVRGTVDVDGWFELEDGLRCHGSMGQPGDWLWHEWEMTQNQKSPTSP